MPPVAARSPAWLVEDEPMRARSVCSRASGSVGAGFGNFITREEIERRDAHDFTDIVRMMPGVRISSP